MFFTDSEVCFPHHLLYYSLNQLLFMIALSHCLFSFELRRRTTPSFAWGTSHHPLCKVRANPGTHTTAILVSLDISGMAFWENIPQDSHPGPVVMIKGGENQLCYISYSIIGTRCIRGVSRNHWTLLWKTWMLISGGYRSQQSFVVLAGVFFRLPGCALLNV